jgi:hypothetical protein
MRDYFVPLKEKFGNLIARASLVNKALRLKLTRQLFNFDKRQRIIP